MHAIYRPPPELGAPGATAGSGALQRWGSRRTARGASVGRRHAFCAPIEDLAWAEWIVRFHHRDHVDALDALFVASGVPASWSDRHAAMIDRCDQLMRQCKGAGAPDAEALWRQRLTVTEAWTGD